MLRSLQISFLVSGLFGDKDTKIFRNLCLHFPRQDGQDRKKEKKIMQIKRSKYQKVKDENI